MSRAVASQQRVPLGLRPDVSEPRLYDAVVDAFRLYHYSRRTEKAYVHWVKRFLDFQGCRHPATLGAAEVTAFLTHLAVHGRVAASTQNQALSALLFLYQKVLGTNLEWLDDVVRAKRPQRLPTVLTRTEVSRLLGALDGLPHLVCLLLYGSGLRLLEALRLRVKDIEFDMGQLTVRDGKGRKDRVTLLSASAAEPLLSHLRGVWKQHQRDLAAGRGTVALPDALERKYPKANRQWGWQSVFPATRAYRDRETGVERRHHLHQALVQKAVNAAVRRAAIHKPASCHTLRHSFPTHLLEDGYDIRTIQELLGHESVETTMIYTHVLKQGGRGVRSPADRLDAMLSSAAARDNAGTSVMGIAATRFKFAASVNCEEPVSRVVQRG